MDKKHSALKEFQVIKFQDRFNYVINQLKNNGVNINMPELDTFHIEIADEIIEEQMRNTILENCKTAYSPYTKTIYIHKTFIDAPQFEYHFTKRMLEHLSTKVEKNKVLSGLSISNGNLSFNYSMNQAMIESFTNTLLGNETMDEDVFSKNIIERHHLAQIQNIVGVETIINSFLNSDYLTLETQFESYGPKLQPLILKMDRLYDINYLPGITLEPNEENLEADIFSQILDAYIKKSVINKQVENKELFESHIITAQTVRGAFGTTEKAGYSGVEKNLQKFNISIKGVEEVNRLNNNLQEAKRSIV